VGLPELSDEQRRAAAAAALAARRRRAEVKRQLAAGDVALGEVLNLAQEDPALAKMRVSDLLAAMPRIGPIRAQVIMEQSDIAATRRVRGLGERQRHTLLAYFERM